MPVNCVSRPFKNTKVRSQNPLGIHITLQFQHPTSKQKQKQKRITSSQVLQQIWYTKSARYSPDSKMKHQQYKNHRVERYLSIPSCVNDLNKQYHICCISCTQNVDIGWTFWLYLQFCCAVGVDFTQHTMVHATTGLNCTLHNLSDENQAWRQGQKALLNSLCGQISLLYTAGIQWFVISDRARREIVRAVSGQLPSTFEASTRFLETRLN